MTQVGENGCAPKKGIDLLFWVPFSWILVSYVVYLVIPDSVQVHNPFIVMTASIYELMNQMAIGILLGIFFVSILGRVPREFIIKVIGRPDSATGVVRATLAGVLLDLCSHGILLVGMKLYERGASAGQVMAFLVSSPWNSLSLTIILVTLIGLKWTLLFIVFSMAIAVVTGLVFLALEKSKVLPQNPNQVTLQSDFKVLPEFKKLLSKADWSLENILSLFRDGVKESKMILKWVFIGALFASLIRTFVSTENLETFFGPDFFGLMMTLVAATLIEVCSEGSAPIAAELFNRARSPGNCFAFLMTGVSTDITEVMAIRERMRSLKIALFLPLVTIPQIILVAWIINLSTTGGF